MTKTAINILVNTEAMNTYDTLCKRFNVSKIVQDPYLSKEFRTRAFLLGATFSTESINGMDYDIIIYNGVLYLLNRCGDVWADW